MPSKSFCQTLYFIRHRGAQERHLNSGACFLSAQTGQDLGPQACVHKWPVTCHVYGFQILIQRHHAKRTECERPCFQVSSQAIIFFLWIVLENVVLQTFQKYSLNTNISHSEFTVICFMPNSESQVLILSQRDPFWVNSALTTKSLGKVLNW